MKLSKSASSLLIRYLAAILFLPISGCVPMYTTDSALYVLGKVTDENGLAVGKATVSLGDLKTKTDANGCFLFDGEYPEHPIKIMISKVGYMTIREERPYSGYYIGAMLTKSDSPNHGKIVWEELDISDPNLHVNC